MIEIGPNLSSALIGVAEAIAIGVAVWAFFKYMRTQK